MLVYAPIIKAEWSYLSSTYQKFFVATTLMWRLDYLLQGLGLLKMYIINELTINDKFSSSIYAHVISLKALYY